MSDLWRLQVALAARLNGWPALVARGFRFHDMRAPQPTAYPYGVISSPLEDEGDVLGTGYDAEFTLDIWSGQTGSSREAYEIADLVDQALGTALNVAGRTVLAMDDAPRALLVEDDGTRHMVIPKRFLTFGDA